MHETGLGQSIGFAMGVTYRKLSAMLASRIRRFELTPEEWVVLYRTRGARWA
jgi:MarR family transcriptional regulator for hemolysin